MTLRLQVALRKTTTLDNLNRGIVLGADSSIRSTFSEYTYVRKDVLIIYQKGHKHKYFSVYLFLFLLNNLKQHI